jgi:hypothetical protein
VPLVEHTAWTIVPEDLDPFPPPPGGDAGTARARCGPGDMMVEELNGELSYTIKTRLCSYGTAEQPALSSVAAGELLTMRIWYFSQLRFEATEATSILAFGSDPVWTRTVPLPATTGGLLLATMPAPVALAMGTPIRWHISNHGENSWNILEASVTRQVPCSELPNGHRPEHQRVPHGEPHHRGALPPGAPRSFTVAP